MLDLIDENFDDSDEFTIQKLEEILKPMGLIQILSEIPYANEVLEANYKFQLVKRARHLL